MMTTTVFSSIERCIRGLDFVIAVAYFIIPGSVLYFIHKNGIKISFPPAEQGLALCRHVALSAAAFVLACGLTHLWRFCFLFEQLSSATLVFVSICATVSTYTALLFLCRMDRLLTIMSTVEVSSRDTLSDMVQAFHIAVEFVPDMVSVHTLEGEVLFTSEQCSCYGYSPNMLYSMNWLSIVLAEDKFLVQDMLEESQDGNPKVIIYRLRTTDNAFIHVESTCKLGRWGGTSAIFMVTRNVQDRMEMLDRTLSIQGEALRIETNRMHAMTLAHDLRTSLAVFEMTLKELRSTASTSEEALRTLENTVKFMVFIVDRTVESCRVLQGEKPVPHLQKLKIEDCLQRCLSILAGYPSSVPVTHTVELSAEAEYFICDQEWLMSILLGYMTNALDNTMFGTVHVSITNDAGWVRFQVIDTGVGIEEKDRKRLFCPFTKLQNKLKPEHGVGLGLYNSAWRIRLLSGTYSVDSNPGGGSIFTCTLPLRKVALPPEPTRRPSANVSAVFDDIQLLVVDDTNVFRKLLAMQLRKRGVKNIDEAHNGEAALTMLKQKRYDIALVDMVMPIMNGDQCIRAYHNWALSTDRWPPTHFIIMSADVLPPDNDILTTGYADAFLKKPLDWLRLMTLLQECIV